MVPKPQRHSDEVCKTLKLAMGGSRCDFCEPPASPASAAPQVRAPSPRGLAPRARGLDMQQETRRVARLCACLALPEMVRRCESKGRPWRDPETDFPWKQTPPPPPPRPPPPLRPRPEPEQEQSSPARQGAALWTRWQERSSAEPGDGFGSRHSCCDASALQEWSLTTFPSCGLAEAESKEQQQGRASEGESVRLCLSVSLSVCVCVSSSLRSFCSEERFGLGPWAL